MPTLVRDGVEFYYRRAGAGLPFFFQHGLGADVGQTLDLLRPPPGFEVLAFDCRAHGQTQPLGDLASITLGVFADDLRALMAHLAIERAIVGGISMGAAVALSFTLRFPRQVTGLVLVRPAWLVNASPLAAQALPRIARLLERHGPADGKRRFMRSALYHRLLAEAPDTAGSLARQFDHPRAVETAPRLQRIPASRPCEDLEHLRAIAVPTLVLANHVDPLHPFEFGATLAELIPGARLAEVTSKSIDKPRHERQVRQLIGDFLTRRFAEQTSPHG